MQHPASPVTLPAHLRDLKGVLVDQSVLDTPMTKRVLGRLAHLPVEVRGHDEGAAGSLQIGRRGASAGRDGGEAEAGQGVVYLKHYKGRFLRSCPGTRHYHCCGYRIVHIGENCPLSCSYCILQAYFQDRVLKVWANQADLFAELESAFRERSDRRWRLGTGEFTDSLTLEPLTGYSRDLVEFLGAYPQACLELKSKVVDLSWMDRVIRPDRVLPAWSMNAPEIQASEEGGSASLEERLRAARTCAQAGFRVCLHFDPVIPFPGWEHGYTQTVEMIADHLRPEDVAYISLGSLRFMPELKQRIEENHPQARYIYAEFITGLDGKQRLLRPPRVRQLRHVVEALRRAGFQDLYLCMESDEVWSAVFGYTPKELGGLGRYLMQRAFGE
ncbi:SPL family radical SAM protein [Desulfonatronum thiodismutans]|uniref:SPL family radical SAM protein n=1 Tax=Desulfonatronum thiodismutans TaxID=159290 RepID=UPI0004ABEC83|nr:radical SAM protein [Desulfonatronum thiodismutans]